MPRHLRSLIRSTGDLELSLVDVPTPPPGPDEVVVRVEAAPINPSDIGLMFGAADMGTAAFTGTPDNPLVTARVPERAMMAMAGRLDQSMPVGLEGAGVVTDAGISREAQALLGKTVAVFGAGMYAQERCVKVDQCLPLPPGTTPADGASCFVNPLTALGMVETARREKHTALVHTAAASNLGQMLIRICREDAIPLVNIVRSEEQVRLLRGLGARYVCNSTSPTFLDDLTDAVAATRATLAFDATGGGRLAAQVLTTMETALARSAAAYSRYGTSTLKQVYIYGCLDPAPLELSGNFGMAWSVGGWLLFSFLERLGADAAHRLRTRVVSGLKTTFASHYSRTVSLAGALSPDAIRTYGNRTTGQKFLIVPSPPAPG